MRKNARHIAAISLGVMGAGFVATFPIARFPVGAVLQSGFEAGLVGGLADWFAVTALFRHPLNIPIPHTALLPRNREKVTNALVNAIQSELLTKESIIGKLSNVDITMLLLNKAKEQLTSESAGERVSSFLAKMLDAIPPEKAAAAIAPAIRVLIRESKPRLLLANLSDGVLAGGYEEPLFQSALEYTERLAIQPETREQLGRLAMKALDQLQLGGFMGFAVNAFAGFMNEDKLGGILQDFVLSMLADLRIPGHETREKALSAIRNAIRELPDNERVVEAAEHWKKNIAESEEVERIIERGAETALEKLSERMADPEYCRSVIIPYLTKMLDAVSRRTNWIKAADDWIRNQAALLVERNHGLIGKLVKENADKLDNDTLIAMMEKHVGKDLQWIRVNGAVCGFAIGIVLGLVHLAVAGG